MVDRYNFRALIDVGMVARQFVALPVESKKSTGPRRKADSVVITTSSLFLRLVPHSRSALHDAAPLTFHNFLTTSTFSFFLLSPDPMSIN